MAIPQFEFGKKREDAKYDMMSQGAGGAGIDPELLRLLAKRRQQQGLSGTRTEPGQQAPQQSSGFRIQSQSIDPRLRAAMMLQQKIKQQQGRSAAPRYASPHGQRRA